MPFSHTPFRFFDHISGCGPLHFHSSASLLNPWCEWATLVFISRVGAWHAWPCFLAFLSLFATVAFCMAFSGCGFPALWLFFLASPLLLSCHPFPTGFRGGSGHFLFLFLFLAVYSLHYFPVGGGVLSWAGGELGLRLMGDLVDCDGISASSQGRKGAGAEEQSPGIYGHSPSPFLFFSRPRGGRGTRMAAFVVYDCLEAFFGALVCVYFSGPSRITKTIKDGEEREK